MLKLTVDTLDGVAEPIRALYEPKDGKFALKVEGLEDTSGLKSALQKEREAARAAKEYQALGLSPAEIAELKLARDKAEEEKARAAGDFDKIRGKLTEQHQSELARLRSELEAVQASEHRAVVTTGLMAALAEAGATNEGLEVLSTILQGRAKIEATDGKRVVKVLDADGVPMIGKGGKDAGFADLAEWAVSKYPSLFKSKTMAGSGTPSGGNSAGSAKRTMSRAEFLKLSPAEASKAALAGLQIID